MARFSTQDAESCFKVGIKAVVGMLPLSRIWFGFTGAEGAVAYRAEYDGIE